MSYLCPHCLRPSNNPHDKINQYCGFCHVFNDETFEPTPLQLLLIQALWGPGPDQAMRAAVWKAAATSSWSEVLLHLIPLWDAQRLEQWQYLTLLEITNEVGREFYKDMSSPR